MKKIMALLLAIGMMAALISFSYAQSCGCRFPNGDYNMRCTADCSCDPAECSGSCCSILPNVPAPLQALVDFFANDIIMKIQEFFQSILAALGVGQ